jgi:hypothetical protein
MKRRFVEETKQEEVKSLDPDDNVRVPIQEVTVPQKERKGYLNCERATKNGMRCLNRSKNNFKIGQDCYQFCTEHVAEALARLIDMLFGKLYFLQMDMTDRFVRKDCHKSRRVTLQNRHDQTTAHIYKALRGGYALRGHGETYFIPDSSALVTFMLNKGFVGKKVAMRIEVAAMSPSEGGDILDFLVGVSGHHEVKIPVDYVYLNNETPNTPTMVVTFEILIDGFEIYLDLTK